MTLHEAVAGRRRAAAGGLPCPLTHGRVRLAGSAGPLAAGSASRRRHRRAAPARRSRSSGPPARRFGLLAAWLVRRAVPTVAAHLPARPGWQALPDYGVLGRVRHRWYVSVWSALAGATSHVVWDGFTHSPAAGHGWGVRLLPVLATRAADGWPWWLVAQQVSTVLGALVALVAAVVIGRRRLLPAWHGPAPAVPRTPWVFWPVAAAVAALYPLTWSHLPYQHANRQPEPDHPGGVMGRAPPRTRSGRSTCPEPPRPGSGSHHCQHPSRPPCLRQGRQPSRPHRDHRGSRRRASLARRRRLISPSRSRPVVGRCTSAAGRDTSGSGARSR